MNFDTAYYNKFCKKFQIFWYKYVENNFNNRKVYMEGTRRRIHGGLCINGVSVTIYFSGPLGL